MIEQLRSLPLRQKVGQLFCIGIGGPEIDEHTRHLLDDVSPGGVCLFSRNIREAKQTRELLDGIRSMVPVSPILSVDQEGGLVDRFRRIMTPMPAANKLRSADDAQELAEIVAESLLILGFNMDFAPVVDVIDDKRARSSNGLFSRYFGRSKEDVVAMAGTFLETLQKGGVAGCLKHFPGLGAAVVDSHEELPEISLSMDDLNATDLFPYRELTKTSDIRSVMVAHAAFPRVNLQETGQNGKLLPSSLSFNFITQLLRGELGFKGLVVTDDLEMGAIVKNYGIGNACRLALNAGADMLAISADAEKIREGYDAVLAAVESGEITGQRLDESLTRIAEFKSRLCEPDGFDAMRLNQLSERTASLNEKLGRN